VIEGAFREGIAASEVVTTIVNRTEDADWKIREVAVNALVELAKHGKIGCVVCK
jgi:hypothetical protein